MPQLTAVQWASLRYVRISLSLAALLLGSAAARTVRADTNEPPGYRETIRAAIEEYETQSYPEAREQFHRAHSMFPNARTLRGLGLTEYELHNYPESVRYLEQALASEVKPLEGKTREDTERVLQRAKGYVGVIRLQLSPSTATVLVDGHESEAEGGPLVLSVGDHIIDIRAAGYLEHRRPLTVRGGEEHLLKIELPKEPERSQGGGPLSERTPERTPAYKKWWVWTLVGVAVAGGVVGTLFATRGERVEPIGTDNTPGPLSTRAE